eukprot:9852889-Karenia_brevis.AAC.1
MQVALAKSRRLLAIFLWIADKILKSGGEVSFEWPRYCIGWMLPELVDLYADMIFALLILMVVPSV